MVSIITNFIDLVREKKQRTFFLLYFLLIIAFFLYSFTQVDLGLTITRNQFLFQIERNFQYIGYFNRTLSIVFFVSLVMLLFVFFGFIFQKSIYQKLSVKQLIGMLVFITPVLAFSYSAFSYDIFNYIFDAKIISFYHQNPYLHKALDFPADPMLSFMHWTHRVYPYGPIWLLLTVPLSYLGLQYFIPTFVLFKLLIGVSFVMSVIGIAKISEKVSPHTSIKSIVFFAFCPLVLIESLVSGHNDITMMAFAIWAVYYLVYKNYILAFVLLFLSIGIKFATIFILPLFCLAYVLDRKNKVFSSDIFFIACFFVMTCALGIVSARTTFQPWYLLYIFPFAALVPKKWIVIPLTFFSFIALGNYVPYLYLGNWDAPIPLYLFWWNFLGFVTTIIIALLLYGNEKKVAS